MIRNFIATQLEQARIVSELAEFANSNIQQPAELARLIVRAAELVSKARKPRGKK